MSVGLQTVGQWVAQVAAEWRDASPAGMAVPLALPYTVVITAPRGCGKPLRVSCGLPTPALCSLSCSFLFTLGGICVFPEATTTFLSPRPRRVALRAVQGVL